MDAYQPSRCDGIHVLDYIGGGYPYECTRCTLRFSVEDVHDMNARAIREADARDALNGIAPDRALYQWENAADLLGGPTAGPRRTCATCGDWANHEHPPYDPTGPHCSRCGGSGHDPDHHVPAAGPPEKPCHLCGGNAMKIRFAISITLAPLPTTRP